MSNVANLNEYRHNKRMESVESKMENNPFTEGLDEYVSLMKLVAYGQSIKMETLIIECTSDDEAIFTDEEGNTYDYKTFHGSKLEDEVENYDLLMCGIIHLSPRNIKVKNSSLLNEYILYAMKRIYESNVQILS